MKKRCAFILYLASAMLAAQEKPRLSLSIGFSGLFRPDANYRKVYQDFSISPYLMASFSVSRNFFVYSHIDYYDEKGKII